MIRTIKRLLVYISLAAFTFAGFTQTVQAAMIGTDQIAAAGLGQQNRDKIAAALDRPEIAAQLENMGVDKSEAKARVAALTDDEAASLAGRLDSLPAGGDSVLGVLVFIFVLLLVTDILGLTKVFPFTRSKR
jgi:hypothetical protein